MYLDKEILFGNNEREIRATLLRDLDHSVYLHSGCIFEQHKDGKKADFFKKIVEAIDNGDDEMCNLIVVYLQSEIYRRERERDYEEPYVPSDHKHYLLCTENHVKEKKHELEDYILNQLGIESCDAYIFAEELI